MCYSIDPLLLLLLTRIESQTLKPIAYLKENGNNHRVMVIAATGQIASQINFY
jgi:hypothetical protein